MVSVALKEMNLEGQKYEKTGEDVKRCKEGEREWMIRERKRKVEESRVASGAGWVGG